ncbi:MAG: hypothetical protein IJW24_03650, partial [Clostridia bacterium]|nr:hypothetical protein [Clostridia bacterium]
FHKFYNKFDWKIWVWVIGLSCVLNVLSLFVTSAIAIASKADVSIVAGFSALIEILGADSETARLFIIDVISAVLFTAIGAVLGITIQLKVYKNKQLQETANAAAKAAEVAADGETVVQVDYDAIIANLEARVKNYIETKDKEALDKDVEDFKKTFVDVLTPAQLNALKLKAKVLGSQDNSSVPERALACDIIQNKL